MKREQSRVPAGSGAVKKAWLISDAKLLALHRKLLKAVALGDRDGAAPGRGIERYAAARVAVWFDLKGTDTIVEAAVAVGMKDALRVAQGNKAGKNRRVVVVWTKKAGDLWWSALEEARKRALPLVFVGEAGERGRGRAGSSRVETKLKPGEELPSIAVDGHDVVAVYRVAHEAIERARKNRGPTLVLLKTFKIGGSAYTDAQADMERYLRGRGLLKPRSKAVTEQVKKKKGKKESS